MNSKPLTNVVSALTARTQLGQIIKRATQKNERFVIDRRGEPAVIIMSIKDYVDTIAPTSGLAEGSPRSCQAERLGQVDHARYRRNHRQRPP